MDFSHYASTSVRRGSTSSGRQKADSERDSRAAIITTVSDISRATNHGCKLLGAHLIRSTTQQTAHPNCFGGFTLAAASKNARLKHVVSYGFLRPACPCVQSCLRENLKLQLVGHPRKTHQPAPKQIIKKRAKSHIKQDAKILAHQKRAKPCIKNVLIPSASKTCQTLYQKRANSYLIKNVQDPGRSENMEFHHSRAKS